jgi:hypothetical protein
LRPAAKFISVEVVSERRALDSASPRRLWFWAFVIALVGTLLRVVWFFRYQDWLPLGFGSIASGHLWALHGFGAELHSNSLELTRAFAPGYGVVVRAASQYGGSAHGTSVALLVIQSLFAALATLITFALARRVLFGFAALVPCVLVTASVALLELPGGLAPQVPLMLLLVLGVWLLTILREQLGERRGRDLTLTVAAGFVLGAALLFNPAVLLLAPVVLWWSFRGVGREHALLLIVATILLPASWFAVADSVFENNLPVEQAQVWAEPASGNVVDSPAAALDRAYALATPWNPRFARGTWSSMNWNYEWILPLSLRGETTYQAATRVLAAVLMTGALLLVLAGVLALFAEAAGSAERLLALPVLTLPLATFFSPGGNLLRVPILPFLMICLCVGAAWLLDIRRSGREHHSFG